MEKLTSKILNFKPITFVLFFIILPFIASIITGMMQFIGIFANFEFIFPLILITLTIAGIIYFVWVWGVMYHIEEKAALDKKYFKIAYWIFFSHAIIRFILGLEMDITKNPILLDNTIWTILEIAGSLYMMFVFASYIYISYFVGKKINSIQDNPRTHEFIYFGLAWCFPIGIPFLQAKLLKQKTILDMILK